MRPARQLIYTVALLLAAVSGDAADLYVDRDYNDIRDALPSLDGADRDNAVLIGSFPIAVWLTGGTAAQTRAKVSNVVKAAAARQETPVLVAYNLPFRDCQQYSAGGSADTQSYQAWIDGLIAGIGSHSVIVIVEPDSLGTIPHYKNLAGVKEWCQPKELSVDAADSRFAELRYAVDKLAQLPKAQVYMDGTHSRWLDVGDAAQRLLRAGVTHTAGFFLNVSNYQPTDELIRYGTRVSACIAGAARLAAAARPKYFKSCATPQDNVAANQEWAHFVIDTSRNGRGSWTSLPNQYVDAQGWCNPPGRGLGERPTLTTSHPLLDAKLWIKVPGESDGQCTRGTEGPLDPERDMIDPPAGKWFKEQAAELIRFATPPVLK